MKHEKTECKICASWLYSLESKWGMFDIAHRGDGDFDITCSGCNRDERITFNYCPECGRDLLGRDEEDEDLLSLDAYQQLAQRTSKNHDHDQIQNGVMGLSGETAEVAKIILPVLDVCRNAMKLYVNAGEMADHVKKANFQGHELDTAKMTEELGDVLWYCAELATGLGVSLGDVACQNIIKLRERYPDGFEAERSVNREA